MKVIDKEIALIGLSKVRIAELPHHSDWFLSFLKGQKVEGIESTRRFLFFFLLSDTEAERREKGREREFKRERERVQEREREREKRKTFVMGDKVHIAITQRLLCVSISTHADGADLEVGLGKVLEDETFIDMFLKVSDVKCRPPGDRKSGGRLLSCCRHFPLLLFGCFALRFGLGEFSG